MFKKITPQKVQHSDGYIVQIADRSSVEYLENNHKAKIEVDFAVLTGVYQDTLSGWIKSSGYEQKMNQTEHDNVLRRIVEGLKFMGCSIEIINTPIHRAAIGFSL